MNLDYYVDHIKSQLTAYGLLETELSDDAWAKVVETALQEVLRYYDQTALISVPSSTCIDLKALEEDNNIKISSISNVYSTVSINGVSSSDYNVSMDPAWIGFWQTGYGTRMTNWTYNFSNYVSLQRIRSTVAGTNLDFREDKIGRKLYINIVDQVPGLTIEYVPEVHTTDEIVGEYWIDILKRLSLAYAKVAVGRARTRFVQSGALWTDDGSTILQEGTTELSALRERLQANAQFLYPVD